MCSDVLTKHLPRALFERHICPFVGDDECFVCEEKTNPTSKQWTHSVAHKGRMSEREMNGKFEHRKWCATDLRD